MMLKNNLLYAFHLIVHPFDGFYDLKHEKKGSKEAAYTIVATLIFVFILKKQFTGYILNPNSSVKINMITEIINIILPLLLWCISNWCITTLMDGEGNFNDIFIATSYALVPIVIINIPLIFISNIISIKEVEFYYFFNMLSFVWSGFLMFIGLMTTHQFTPGKTIVTIVIAICGMIAMLFIGLIFFALLQQLINFIYLIFREFSLRQ